MEIDPRRLRFLLAIARTGGVLAAADELAVTASAVSQQLARLEDETGLTLVERTPRGTVLTTAGRTLVEAAEGIERMLDLARTRLSSDDADPAGVVGLGGFQSFLTTVLVPRLPAWRERYPRIRLNIVESDRNTLLRSLRSGEIDAAVVEFDAGESSRPLASGMREVPLLDEPWKLVIPAGSLIASDVVDLAGIGLPWLGVDPGAASWQAVRRVRRAVGAVDPPKHTFQDSQTALALVAAGEGMALFPSLALHGAVPAGVEAVDIPGLGTRRIVLRYRERAQAPSEALSTVTALVREAAATFGVKDLPEQMQ